jgi:tetratricopeptide (TPR) repeat protein
MSTSPRPHRPWLYLTLFALGILGWIAIATFLKADKFQQAESAYQKGDCTTAIANFEQVINGNGLDLDDYQARAQSRKSECQALQSAIKQQESGQGNNALNAYSNMLERFPQSALAPVIRQQTQTLFSPDQITTLAKPNVCDRIPTLEQQQLIYQPKTNLSRIYQGCGKMYVTAKKPSNAVKLYEQFLAQHPEQNKNAAIKKDLAVALIAEARQSGAGTILPPGASGFTADGSTLLEIRNDSPSKLRLVFSGPETQYQEIAPCTSCKRHFTTPPPSCPEKGAIATYKLKPGTYDLVVKAIDEQGVRPFVGKWNLAAGRGYSSCFFIVSQPGGAIPNSPPPIPLNLKREDFEPKTSN